MNSNRNQNPLQILFQAAAENKQQIAAIMVEMDMHFDSLVATLPPKQLESFHCNMLQRRAYHLTVSKHAAKKTGDLELRQRIRDSLKGLAKSAKEYNRTKSFNTGIRDARSDILAGKFKPPKKLIVLSKN